MPSSRAGPCLPHANSSLTPNTDLPFAFSPPVPHRHHLLPPFRTFGQADDASSAAGDEMSIEMFKYTIITAVQNMYGQVGRAAIDPDVLSYDAPTCVAVLAVDDR